MRFVSRARARGRSVRRAVTAGRPRLSYRRTITPCPLSAGLIVSTITAGWSVEIVLGSAAPGLTSTGLFRRYPSRTTPARSSGANGRMA